MKHMLLIALSQKAASLEMANDSISFVAFDSCVLKQLHRWFFVPLLKSA